MVWKVYYNDVLLKRVASGVIEEDLNKPIDYFSLVLINPTAAVRATFAQSHIIGTNKITIYRGSVLKFTGFIEQLKPLGLNLELKGRGMGVLLLDERTSRDDEYINQTGATVINDLLTKYSTKVTAGTISYTETLNGTIRFNHDNLLYAIAKTCNNNAKDLWVLADSTLNVGIRTRGTVGSPNATFYGGKEIFVSAPKKGIQDLVNRQRVFGAGDGLNQIQCCVPFIDINLPDTDRSGGFDGAAGSSPNDCVHAGATTSQSTYGIMEGAPHVDNSIASLSQAVDVAKAILDTFATLNENLSIKFAKYQDVQVGDWIRIIDVKQAVDDTTRIKKIVHNFGIGVDGINVELFNPYIETEDKLNLSKRNSDVSDIHGLGATNIFQVASYENCDASHPLNLRFRLPDDIVIVNRVLCSFKLKDYRAYHTGLAADAAHTHTLAQKVYDESLKTGTPDIYLVGELFFNAIDGYKFGSDDATRTLLAETSSAGTSHNHAVTYAIHEVALTSPSVVVTAGIEGAETAVGTYTTDQNEIDITSNIGATGNWMNVKFVPNKPMRIECNIYVKCYIESK